MDSSIPEKKTKDSNMESPEDSKVNKAMCQILNSLKKLTEIRMENESLKSLEFLDFPGPLDDIMESLIKSMKHFHYLQSGIHLNSSLTNHYDGIFNFYFSLITGNPPNKEDPEDKQTMPNMVDFDNIKDATKGPVPSALSLRMKSIRELEKSLTGNPLEEPTTSSESQKKENTDCVPQGWFSLDLANLKITPEEFEEFQMEIENECLSERWLCSDMNISDEESDDTFVP